MAFTLKYTASEAEQMVKEYYPHEYLTKIANCKAHLKALADRHKISLRKSYEKFIMPHAQEGDAILFFVALSQLNKIDQLSNSEKAELVNKLEDERQQIANQIVALENSQTTSYEDKKIIRSYYTKRQQELTAKIDELINSIEVVEPKLVIFQPGLFDTSANS